jgi:hypothetical protein
LVTAVAAALAMSGCGGGDDQSARPAPTPQYKIPDSTAPTPAPTTAPTIAPTIAAAETVEVAGSGSADSFTAGMTDYCRSYYLGQSRAEDAYPRPDSQSMVAFEQAAAASAQETEAQLAQLTPPAELATTFAAFVDQTHRLTTARNAMAGYLANTGVEGPAGDDFDAASSARWPLATALHAPGCDGKLPAAQEKAVVTALRRFETTADSTAACAELATPGFLQTRFFDLPDPLAGCISSRDSQAAGAGLASDIDVQVVTGSDGIAATVHYSLVGGCECGADTVARLHYADGQWRVSSFGS